MTAIALEANAKGYGALLLRVALGTMWIAHGTMKLTVFSVSGFASWLDNLGLPGWAAGPVIAAEILGGAAILLGVYGRWLSLALIPVLLVAMWTHLPNGWLFTNNGGGWEFPAFLIVASLAHVLNGDGAWALKSR